MISPLMILEDTKVWALIQVDSTKRMNFSVFIQIHQFVWFSFMTLIHGGNTIDILLKCGHYSAQSARQIWIWRPSQNLKPNEFTGPKL